SGRGIKRSNKYQNDSEEESKSKKPRRACERSGCPAKVPICFARATERCAGSSWTSRWYHISQGEHFCNECFDFYYRSHKDGYAKFAEWKRKWSTHGKNDPKLMLFFSDQMLPYWCQCTTKTCGKWRQLSKECQFTSELVARFKCGMTSTGVKRVEATQYRRWYSQVTSAPCLYSSPSAPFLTGYYPDGVGLSVSDDSVREVQPNPLGELSSVSISFKKYPGGLIQPFTKDEQTLTALSFHPDLIETDEQLTFSHLTSENPMLYLALRNLIMSLWALDLTQWLTKEKCRNNLICRGLTRIRLVDDIEPMLQYLTSKSYINTGLLSIPTELHIQDCQQEVLVIGGGISGITSARFLKQMGIKVKVLEASDCIGGRIKDSKKFGQCVGSGAQLLIGHINNPISIISHQAGLENKIVKEHCSLMSCTGDIIDPQVDRRIDFHFNAMLDVIAEWRQGKGAKSDVNLLDKFYEMHKQFKEESQLPFTEEEEKILQFHLSNLEYACGASLSRVSTLNWDHNESQPQFTGDVVILKDGYSKILEKLSENLDIQYNTQVCGIDYSSESIKVTTNTSSFTAHKVLVTVPLGILQKQCIQFTPSLSERKTKAINSLGAGSLEKVCLQFDKKFWKSKTDGDDFFGHVPVSESQRGLFNVFYDLSTSENESGILVTNISGNALKLMQDKSDKEIMEMCLKTLRSLFPQETVPEPRNFLVTHWSDDPHIGMAYSYMPIGCDGSIYDILAEELDDRVYFAGEATNRQFPQSVTGAYLSGIREASKIISNIKAGLSQNNS
ncbi:hypothetical protein LOTGIDRAFT_145165, partial [Lottia gigantea]